MVRYSTDEAPENEANITTPPPSYNPSEAPLVYKVDYPPQKNLTREFKDTLRETFFHDNPLRQYKNQPRSAKFMMGLKFLFPVFEWGRTYNFSKFKGDLIAGLTIASLCIPQDIGYSKLANLDPQYGLCKFHLFMSCIVVSIFLSNFDLLRSYYNQLTF
jgi:sulfate transporter 1, high-affinity